MVLFPDRQSFICLVCRRDLFIGELAQARAGAQFSAVVADFVHRRLVGWWLLWLAARVARW
ncbi:hypothetical protein [Streptomyces sp. NPDC087300]|uniref:hypothetical protein n=1 Tax=Streptomyces sp. NPDC087300 TaxID=3365780 RepID=UPI003816120C